MTKNTKINSLELDDLPAHGSSGSNRSPVTIDNESASSANKNEEVAPDPGATNALKVEAVSKLRAMGLVAVAFDSSTNKAVENAWQTSADFESVGAYFTENPEHEVRLQLPPGVIALHARADNADSKFMSMIKQVGVAPRLWLKSDRAETVLFRFEGAEAQVVGTIVDGVSIRGSKACLKAPLGDDWTRSGLNADDVNELGIATAAALVSIKREFGPEKTTALDTYSLRGQSSALQQTIKSSEPFLGSLCLTGQLTIWYAAPNTGKTLITLHLLDGASFEGSRVYYVNADDTAEGLVEKLGLLEDIGVDVLAPGHNGFEPAHLVERMNEMIRTGEAKDCVIILDTIKKFADLMHKKESAAFANTCRKFALKGGTVLALGHVTKNGKADGKPSYAGTTDFVEDFDAAYFLVEMGEKGADKLVRFDNFKRRGNSATAAGFAYDQSPELSYIERLASVRSIDVDEIDDFEGKLREAEDAEVIDVIRTALNIQPMAKMALAKTVSLKAHIGRQSIIRVIERYQGSNPSKHYWNFVVGDRGRKTYGLLYGPPVPETIAAAG